MRGAPVPIQRVLNHRGLTTERDMAPFTLDNSFFTMRFCGARNENRPVVICTHSGVVG